MDKKLRVGIIGCGGIANGKHMPSLKAIGRVDMVAFCDIIVEKAEKAAKEYGTCLLYTSHSTESKWDHGANPYTRGSVAARILG